MIAQSLESRLLLHVIAELQISEHMKRETCETVPNMSTSAMQNHMSYHNIEKEPRSWRR
jgi:hypothetical protein